MDSPSPRTRPVLLWALLCLALGVAAVVTGVLRYDALPERYPTHFGFSGAPDAFGTKSWATVLGPLVIGQLSAVVLLALALAIPGKGAGIRSPLAALGCAIGGGVSLMCLSEYLADDAVPAPWVLWAFLVAVLAATVWFVVVTVRMSRRELEGDPDREHWRLGGLVYANPDDPDVLVSRRLGMGTTINLGRPLGWAVLALILAPVLIVVVMVVLTT
ncbi:hypothetical protein ASG73_10210 [Janibacter sp. Soil728]|uniref:DUF1648 domain-containing protein n=1 Tax=Janibacter sp. Soil728 TaxID=1736393 RepID=UPI0006F9B470|nr:DUF1648 domain-containing protein [Janibacter sp. Soil728]KRE37962.1 hypothetical protein ASG73_10210 [Janibacter sp. Soil728]